MFSIFKKKPQNFFSQKEKDQITEAIKTAETKTSGEIRVFIENKCKYPDALDHAKELFSELKMEATKERNGVLVYVAVKDRKLAVYGDKGIHDKLGDEYWNNAVKNMVSQFTSSNYAKGIEGMILSVGDALKLHFPYNADTDTNELSDEIVFGK